MTAVLLTLLLASSFAADYVAPKKGKPVLVLMHGLGAGPGEWDGFVSSLAARGYGSLALDAKGGGAEAMAAEFAAALKRLAKQGVPASRTVLGGASLGANAALLVASREPRVPFVLLLSPGAEYQGLRLDRGLSGWRGPLILGAARDDAYAWLTCEAVRGAVGPRARVIEGRSGHGVRMFEGPGGEDFLKRLLLELDRLTKATSSGSRPSASGSR